MVYNYRRVPRDSTKEIPAQGSVISGRPDAIFLRNRYQKEIDNTYAGVVNAVHFLEEKNDELKQIFNKSQSFKHDIEAHEKERANLFNSLGNVLNKETDFEKKMWETTQKGRKVKSVTIKQKFKDSDVDEMRYDSMLEYLKQYPEYGSKSTFRKITDKIDEKERELRHQKKEYHKAVSDYNHLRSTFEQDIRKAEDNFAEYERILEEGEKKLSETRYRRSVFYKVASAKVQAEVNLDTLSHRIKKFRNTLEIIKREHSQNKGKELVELAY